MKVLVTGGTGFVGSAAVARLLGAGHDVRLLVRSADKVATALAPHAVMVDDVVVGDVMDEASMTAAVEDCDAMIHAANLFDLDARRYDRMRQINEDGTDAALGIASAAGLDPIVYVSSFVALLPSAGTVSGESPVGDPAPAYSKTKALGERVARRYQDAGAPVVTVYPGLIMGPDDPYLGDSSTMTMNALRGRFGLLPAGGLPVSDVRDVAALLTAVMRRGQGPRRVVAVGHDIDFRAWVAKLGELTGQTLKTRTIPGGMALFAGRAADFVARFTGPLALNYEAPWLVVNSAPSDTSSLPREMGRATTPLEVTMTDTVRWLHSAGHISDQIAGDLAA